MAIGLTASHDMSSPTGIIVFLRRLHSLLMVRKLREEGRNWMLMPHHLSRRILRKPQTFLWNSNCEIIFFVRILKNATREPKQSYKTVLRYRAVEVK